MHSKTRTNTGNIETTERLYLRSVILDNILNQKNDDSRQYYTLIKKCTFGISDYGNKWWEH
jgi:hypothetical protein